MTLGKRALSLIFPVVLAGYVLAASLIYYVQSSSILALALSVGCLIALTRKRPGARRKRPLR